MLRHAATKYAQCIRATGGLGATRSYAKQGGAAKRALSKQQLQGVKPDPPAEVPPTTPPPAAATPPPANGGGDNGNMMAIGVVALALAGGGGYYYYNMESDAVPAESTPAAVEEEKASDAPAAEEAKTEEVTSITAEDGSNRVVQIEIPMEEGTRPASAETTPAETAHPEDGNKLTLESMQPKKKSAKIPTSSVADSVKELQASIDLETSEVTKRANAEVMRSFDESLFQGLDDMSAAQLKAKIMQLATEMKDRTKWEALRLKEFLAMKEKETGDKYLDVLQKQRLEFESILARRLMEQEHELTLQSNSKLQAKDGAVKDLIDGAIEKLRAEHEAEKEELVKNKTQEFDIKYQQEFLDKVAELQKGAIEKLEQKTQAVESLNKKVQDLESALASSENYHEGSMQAHKLSAAALALAEKMESNQGAGIELGALKAVAGQDNVIAAALSSIPSSLAEGVPTLPELQARFDKVASKTRQAALVPAGQSGLEGQLAGMVFATLKFPPKPDDPSPEDDKDAAEYVLVRARQHVQLGELEKAVDQLSKLKGQAAFTVQGWKQDAADRVAVEQALKVIKMECALLNESMSKAP
ncbi:MICOS complex subunit MIC60 [Seminavis robusta]|uniref:MICOS complex subunit MIC60 n=1 Tax=Seminavis robusta TaxID=568900 RepID=A0A9N8EW24_9STRA|nr:MICOS complex subunit MIC60 [Seminavis robusta]|eukprot:Sro1861_g302210.1 MICOS complex subunit MIC60 (586) ;mRNA; f:16230-18155